MEEHANIDRIPPQNIDAEASVLGCMLLEGEACGLAISKIVTEDFYRSSHRTIYNSLCEMYHEGITPDGLLLRDALKKENKLEQCGGSEYIHSLMSVVPSTANIEEYIKAVVKEARARLLIEAATSLLRDAESDPMEALAKHTERLDNVAARSKSSSMTAKEALDRLGDSIPWVIPDIKKLQEKTGGIYSSGLTLISGGEGSGKTTLAMQLLARIAEAGNEIYVWSYDQQAGRLVEMMAKSIFHVPEANDMHLDVASKLPLEFDDGDFELGRVLATMRMKANSGVRWFLIDYLSLMDVQGSWKADWEMSAQAAKRLKVLAQQLDVFVLVIQSTTEGNDDRPTPRKIAGRRELRHAADQIWWLEPPAVDKREGKEKEPWELLVFKTRFGGTSRILLDFNGACRYFQDWSSNPPWAKDTHDEFPIEF